MVPLDPAVFQLGSISYEVLRNNILILTFATLFVLVTFHFCKSSLGQKKKHSIPKTRHSLLTLKQHTVYTFLILFSLLLDRVGLTIIKVFYLDLGTRNAFLAFWFDEIIFFILIHVLSPALICLKASQKLEAFNGLRGKKFPGEYELRKSDIFPRRDFCPNPYERIINEEQEEKFERKRKVAKVDQIHEVGQNIQNFM